MAHATSTGVADYVPGWLVGMVSVAAVPTLAVLWLVAPVGAVHEVRGPRHWPARLHPELERAAAGSG